MPTVATINITDKSPEILKAMRRQVLLGLESIGQECEGYAKDDCPVDTGRLRNSIAHKVEGGEDTVYIGTNVEYAPYVEYGEYRHITGKNHFLRDAATNHGDHYKAIMEAALES
jgi:hypothetical protein